MAGLFMRLAVAVALTGVLAILPAGRADAALVAYYGFDDGSGSIAAPSVGAVNGVLAGDAAFVGGGVAGGAVSMSNAGSGLVNFGTSLALGSPFSVQIWVNTTLAAGVPFGYHYASVAAGAVIAVGDLGDGCASPAGTMELYVGYPCSGASSIVVNDGQWHQLVGVYDGTHSQVYVDGQFQTQSTGNTLVAPPGGTEVLAGGITVAGTPTNSYTGLLDELAIYNSALNAGDVEALYNSLVSVPEPGSMMLLAAGLGGLACATRGRSRRLG